MSLKSWSANRAVLVFALAYLAQVNFVIHSYFALLIALITVVILLRTVWAIIVGTRRRRITISESDAGKDASQVNFVIPGYLFGVIYWPKIFHGPPGNVVKAGQTVEVIYGPGQITKFEFW